MEYWRQLSITIVMVPHKAHEFAVLLDDQAGDRHKAMRALVKSGDTEKIVFFAGEEMVCSVSNAAARPCRHVVLVPYQTCVTCNRW